MSATATITATPATIAKGARIVPADTTVTHAAAAVLASERLAEALAAATSAGNAVLIKRYGADIDPAAVKLAKRAADEMSGGTKSRGGARADVLAVLATLADVDTITDRTFVAAARARLDELAADKRARTEHKKELAAKVNDKSATIESRTGALEVLAGMDAADSAVKSAAIVTRLNGAIMAARVDGMSEVDMLALVAAAFKVAL